MQQGNKKADRVIRVDGHTFCLHHVYDEVEREYMLDYPNFEEQPVYTKDGRPFALSVQESCPLGKPYNPEDAFPYDCNECAYFQLESLADAIGICMCEALRQKENQQPESSQNI